MPAHNGRFGASGALSRVNNICVFSRRRLALKMCESRNFGNMPDVMCYVGDSNVKTEKIVELNKKSKWKT